ncbi:hypothetical protein BDZ85DRAFT_277456 [Elsinoe ampelina]|uniref:Uncharacterized protein n=1 Tax=Elsinoe ampelina TaxID=302913 RepID=A0A6A6GP99_9PEZI|nr:hypothetical protein BDZ85DRAFT_277456 [Elsinoe ampelina]
MSPGLDATLSDLTPLSEDSPDPIAAAVRAPLPGHATLPAVLTPGQDLLPQPSLDAIVGADIVPATLTDSNLSVKGGPGLRLPSFQELGIANPRPDNLAGDTCLGAANPSVRQRLSDPVTSNMAASLRSMRLDSFSSIDNLGPLARTLSIDGEGELPPPVRRQSQLIETLTPPEDKSAILWNSLSQADEQYIATSRPTRGQSDPVPPSPANPSIIPREIPRVTIAPRIELHRTTSDYQRMPFVDRAASAILMNLRSAQSGDAVSLKVLSHALPCPSPSGFAFPAVISALQVNTPGSPLCWINVFHALRKSNLSELPTSPPSTPGQPGGGNDYFTSKTFDSAVPIIDYQDNLTSDLPRSPLPVVAPESMNVSIVERYIPPTSANEFSEMFKLNGRSLLVDRLMELSPDNGTLLFIYPTSTGAQTFMRDYLGPILDPVIRMMKSINNLPLELATLLGSMSAVKTMLDYDTLHKKVQELCAAMGQPNSTMQRFTRKQSGFVLESASKETVKIERSVWIDNWWIKQEKPRIREAINNHFGRGAQTGEVTPMSMTNALLNGASRKEYPSGEPQNGIEVGVFVIKRTS